MPPASQAIAAAIRANQLGRAASLAKALPSEAERRLWRGTFAILNNDPVTAIRTLRRTSGNNSGSGEGHHPKALGVAYYLARQYLLFRGQMDEAIQRDPADFGPYYFLGRHYDADADDCTEAVRWFRLALERNPGYARAHAHLGSCLERQGQAAEAEREYRAALALPIAQLGMARLKQAAGQTREALVWAAKAAAADPGDPAGHRLAARLHEQLGQAQQAIAALERAARAAPNEASTFYQLHRLYRAAGDESKAKAALVEYERLRAVYN